MQIEGPSVIEFQKTFLKARAKTETTVPELKPNTPPKPSGKEAVRVVAGWADQSVNAIYATMLSAVASSDATVHITMAYFVPDPQTLEALKEAARRGVDVKLILPGFSDFWAVWHAGRSHYTELLAAGVKIYERKDRLLHANTAVIDGVRTTIGSSNLDWRSFLHNHELNAVIVGSEFATQMEGMFERELVAAAVRRRSRSH
ncbi:MAG: phospholipase D-like domain-containing protein [Casimicrobiaceae bacterium]